MISPRFVLLVWLAAPTWAVAQVTHNGPVIDDRGPSTSSGPNYFQAPPSALPKPAAPNSNPNSTGGMANLTANLATPGLGAPAVLGMPPAYPAPGNAIPAAAPAAVSTMPVVASGPDISTVPLTTSLDEIDDKYILKQGDQIVYQVAEDEDSRQLLLVDENGEVQVPYLKHTVKAAGSSLHDFVKNLRVELEDPAAKLYRTATIGVALFHTDRSRGHIVVLGNVLNPGYVNIPSDRILTLANVLQAAGGFNQVADRRHVTITRQAADPASSDPAKREPTRIPVDVQALYDKGQEPSAVMLPGDFVEVPSLNETTGYVTVSGEIRTQPGLRIPLPTNEPLTVSQAILQAGWTDFSIHTVKLTRYEKNQDGREQKNDYLVDVDAALRGEKGKDMDLKAGDFIVVDYSFFARR